MVRIVHDAGGVRGLIVVLDFFSEAVEKRLFELGNNGIFHAAKRSMAGLNIAGERMPPFPDDIFRLANAGDRPLSRGGRWGRSCGDRSRRGARALVRTDQESAVPPFDLCCDRFEQ